MSQPAETAELGVIHDIGYRHYTGARLGRDYILRSLYAESLKGAYGLGRSAKSKVMPVILLTIMTLPALIIAIVAGVTNADKLPLPYTQYFGALQLAIIVYVASQAPAAVSRDLRFRVMPLYFSRPLRRTDYVLAKYTALASAVFILIGIPLTVLYVGALLGKLPFWAQTRGYLSAVVGALVFAALLAAIGLLIASVTPKRGFGVAAVITVLLVFTALSGILSGIVGHKKPKLAAYFGLIDPARMVDGVQAWVFNAKPFEPYPPPGDVGGAVFLLVTIAVIAGCYALLLLRYRKVSAT